MKTTLKAFEKRAKSINPWIAKEASRDAEAIRSETEQSLSRHRRKGADALEPDRSLPRKVESTGFEGATRRITEELHLVRDFCGGPVLHKTNRKKPVASPRRDLHRLLFRKSDSPLDRSLPDTAVGRVMLERHIQRLLTIHPSMRRLPKALLASPFFHV